VIDAAERALLASTFEDALAKAAAPGAADRVLAELGWLDLLSAEPDDALAVVFTALGRTNRAATALDDVVLWSLGFTARPELAVVLPPFTRWSPPGRIAAEQCQASGIATARSAGAAEIAVLCAAGRDVCAVAVPRASLQVRPADGVDPDGGWQVVHGEHPAGAASTTDVRFDGDAWAHVVAVARRAVGHQLAGACRAMLDLARQHAIDRVQFGRPIASFQAVRHRLADVLVAIEALEATLDAAADDPGPETAALAKATAARTARVTATHCQQVLAGVGFTTDHPFHGYLARTMVLAGLFGSADAIAADLGRQLLEARRVPRLIEL
jgi:hypothetical protein